MTLIVNQPAITNAQTSYGVVDPRSESSQLASVQVEVTLGGSHHVATSGEVRLSFSQGRRFAGRFDLTASAEGEAARSVQGSFDGTWSLSCFKLVSSDASGGDLPASPGGDPEDPRPQWQSDAAFDSPFCAALFGRGESI